MRSCHQVADYFLSLSDPETGDLISNLKLQKLVYYAQGFHLAVFDEPLFGERIEAWTHGPVVPDLYHTYKQHAAGFIPPPDSIDTSCFSDDQKELLDEVNEVYGQFSAWKLRNMTHEESPWIEASTNQGEISHDAMKEYFKTQLV